MSLDPNQAAAEARAASEAAQPLLGQEGSIPAELAHAGAIIDKAIEYMLGKDLPPLAVASALLGGALSVLARNMDRAAILRMLANAAASVEAGEFHQPDGGPQGQC